jgi:hypothetical protein
MAKKSIPMPAPTSPDDGKYGDWQVKDAAETIMKAHEHMADPMMMKHVNKHLHIKSKAIKSIKDIQSAYNSKFGPEAENAQEDAQEGGIEEPIPAKTSRHLARKKLAK